ALSMGVIFAIILETEFELFFGRYLERLGWGNFDTNANWAQFFHRLEPYLWLIAMTGRPWKKATSVLGGGGRPMPPPGTSFRCAAEFGRYPRQLKSVLNGV